MEVRGWRGEYAEARDLFLAGRPALFPHGTYAMCTTWGAEAAEPHPDAIVARPGPLLDEVKAELENACRDAESGHVQVLEEVRAAWRDEAAEVVAVDELDFEDPSSSSSGPAESRSGTARVEPQEETPRPVAEVRHRFDRDRDAPATHPRRLVIERDRRNNKGRSDPPS